MLRLECHHNICLEDCKGYLESALGDIGMFPVKCPMHYEHCKGILDANIARRILSEPQFRRFLDFSDRALYGDGKHIIRYCLIYSLFELTSHHYCCYRL